MSRTRSFRGASYSRWRAHATTALHRSRRSSSPSALPASLLLLAVLLPLALLLLLLLA